MRRPFIRLCLCMAAAAVIVVQACSQGGGAAATATPRPAPALERLLDRVGDDGSIDKDTALQAFALAFAPPPGVARPAGSGERILSGSGPLRWLVPHLGELSPPQRQAVIAAVPRPPRARAAAGDWLLVGSAEETKFQGLVKEARVHYEGGLGVSLKIPIVVTLNDKDLYDSHAYAFPLDAAGGQSGAADECDVYFNPRIRKDTSGAQREAAFHEVFHCFQAQMYANLADYYSNAKGAAWLIEGGALYVGDEAAGVAPIAATWWKRYFDTPSRPLFKRTYDANGFFAHVANTGTDPLTAFPKAVQAIESGGSPAAFGVFAGSSPDKLVDSWPTSLLRKPGMGTEWDTTATGITADATIPASIPIGAGATASGRAPGYANDDRQLGFSAEVSVVGAAVHGRMRAVSGDFDSTSPNGVYCTKPGGCSCPSGSPRAAAKFKDLAPGPYYLAVGGGATGSAWSAAGFSLSDFCQKSPMDDCLIGTWRLVSPPALPSRTVLNHLNEVATFTKDGLITFTVDADASQDPVTVTLGGAAKVTVLTIAGTMQPLSGDFSGIRLTASLYGVQFFNGGFNDFFPGLDQELTPVAYACSGSSLTLTGASGRQWGFARG